MASNDAQEYTSDRGARSEGKQPSRYRHVAAVHAKQRTSCLSHDSEQSPSFLGFRNLMVIVLGEKRSLLPIFHVSADVWH